MSTAPPTNNGSVNLRKTHPNLYRLVMGIALMYVALGINFLVFTPTFFVWDQPNELWAAIFLGLGVGLIVFLNLIRRPHALQITMAVAVFYTLFFACGTMQPAFEGKGSAQLPILYVGLGVLVAVMLLEPVVNTWTRRDT